MATNGVSTQTTTTASRLRKFLLSGLVVRVLIALLISFFIVMAFFVTGAGSH